LELYLFFFSSAEVTVNAALLPSGENVGLDKNFRLQNSFISTGFNMDHSVPFFCIIHRRHTFFKRSGHFSRIVPTRIYASESFLIFVLDKPPACMYN